MFKNMLGDSAALSALFSGPLADLVGKMAGLHGEFYGRELRRLLRRPAISREQRTRDFQFSTPLQQLVDLADCDRVNPEFFDLGFSVDLLPRLDGHHAYKPLSRRGVMYLMDEVDRALAADKLVDGDLGELLMFAAANEPTVEDTVVIARRSKGRRACIDLAHSTDVLPAIHDNKGHRILTWVEPSAVLNTCFFLVKPLGST